MPKWLIVSIVGPFEIDGTPCKSTTESRYDQVIAFSQPAFPFTQAKWDGTIGGVAEMIDIDHYFLSSHTHALRSCINDAQVGLVRHQPMYVISSEVIAFHDLG